MQSGSVHLGESMGMLVLGNRGDVSGMFDVTCTTRFFMALA